MPRGRETSISEKAWQDFVGSLADTEMLIEADGRFRVVLAPENPGVANWIDTAGYTEGQICCRALMSAEPLAIKFRVVKLSEL